MDFLKTSQTIKTHSRSPAKLILSGEHSVVYGHPAISLPIPLYSHCQITITPAEQTSFDISLLDLTKTQTFSISDFKKQTSNIEKRYKNFQQHSLLIDQVLHTDFDLILMTLKTFSALCKIPTGRWQIEIHSEILIGRGLGSSASIIVSVLKALENVCQIKLDDKFLSLTQSIENYQHGHSSGLDPTTIYLNYPIEYQNREFSKIRLGQLPSPLKAWLIDSGKSKNSTGDTVCYVRDHFGTNQSIWQQFATTTRQIQTAWQTKNSHQLLQAVKSNQQLLCQIGVVPTALQAWLTELEQQTTGSGKVCGAGAIEGHSAGVVLFLSESSPAEFCQQHQLSFFELDL